jgi:hypothetical protein
MGHRANNPDGDSGLMAGALAAGTRDLGALDQVVIGTQSGFFRGFGVAAP